MSRPRSIHRGQLVEALNGSLVLLGWQAELIRSALAELGESPAPGDQPDIPKPGQTHRARRRRPR